MQVYALIPDRAFAQNCQSLRYGATLCKRGKAYEVFGPSGRKAYQGICGEYIETPYSTNDQSIACQYYSMACGGRRPKQDGFKDLWAPAC